MIKIAIDAMGGDNAPKAVVKGAVNFTNDNKDTKIFLCGDESSLKKELSDLNYDKEKIEIVHCSEVITNEEQPMVAIKQKKDSSLVRAITMVKKGEADCIISAGSTGSLLTASTIIIGRIRGVKRPTLAAIVPAGKGKNFILADSGANVDSKAEYISQFGVLGSIYIEKMLGVSSPRVGLLNVGTEDGKGDSLAKETFKLLKQEKINFIGNIEARDVPNGIADVVVCDGFVGNVMLKLYEGAGKMFGEELKDSLMKSTISKIGALISKKSLDEFKGKFDTRKAGGAPIIGLKGLSVKAHGNSDEVAFYYGLKQCRLFIEKDITNTITDYFKE